ncbi:MAG: tetratricopeptide repeat protein [Candidatus Cloacimonetes bacterium]|nr:tetratricopeptide repeat protein [Candidatus Cloacimonadota bacterium]
MKWTFFAVFLLLFSLLAARAADSILVRIRDYSYDEQIRFLYELVTIYKDTDFEKSLIYADYALQIAEINADRPQMAQMHFLIGTIHYHTGDYEKSLSSSLKALKMFESLNNKKGIAQALNSLGIVYIKINNNQSLPTFQRAMEIYKELKDDAGVIKVLNSIASIFFQNREYVKALDLYEEIYSLSIQNGYYKMASTALNNLGLTYKNLGNIQKAINQFEKSLTIKRDTKDLDGVSTSLLNLANVYRLNKEIKKAHQLYDEALQIGTRIKANEIIIKANYGKYQCSLEENNYKDALNSYIVANQFKDSLYTEESNRKLAELQVQYDTYSKEREIDLLQKENQLKDYRFYQAIALFLLFFVIAASLLYITVQQRRKQKLKQLLNAKLEKKNQELNQTNELLKTSELQLKETIAAKDKLFSVVAHDLRNPFNALLNYIEMLNESYDMLDETKRRDYLSKILMTVNNILALLENLLAWASSQQERIDASFDIFNLSKMVDTIVKLFYEQSLQKKIEIVMSIPEELEITTDSNILSAIIRNLINNSLKFTPSGGKISVESETTDEYLHISVVDTGIGIKKENLTKLFSLNSNFSTKGTNKEKGSGLGLIICREFAEKLGGTITVESEEGKGSRFTISLKREDLDF